MIPRPIFFRRVACISALQMLTLFSVLGQVDSSLARRPSVRIESRLSEGEQALARARAAANRQNVGQAYAEYGTALRLVPRTAPQYAEALRGFSESGVKLAQQRLREGRAPEAERIAREVLSANPGYRPALALLASASPAQKEVPIVRSATPPPVPRTGFATTPAPRATPEPQIIFRGKPPTTTALAAAQREAEQRAAAEMAAAERTDPPPQKAKPQTKSEPMPDTTDLPEEGPATTPRGQKHKVKQPLVKVFFATDRIPSGGKGPSNYFGTKWNREGDHLITGVVTVSIPPVHKPGAVERPFKWWIFERKEDAKKHFVLTELKVSKGDDFYSLLRSENDARSPDDRSAFVFIHGFNVTFDDAAYRTAQLASDLDFRGVPILYSWPSQGKLLAYDGDQETVEWSSPHLQGFLERVARESGAMRIHLVAHSMGNRLLTSALVGIGRQPDIQPMFENVIMAAPDVNAYTFSDQIWPGIQKAAKRFTLYASSADRALMASKEAKGPHDFDRLGEAGPKLVVISGLDTVDASGIDTTLLGHSYIDSCKPVMNDLQLLIAKGFAPLQRKLKDRQKGGLGYWAFP